MTGQLKDNDMDQLESWIGGGPKTFTLLYSATKDGCVANTFHQKCDNQGPTVTVLYNPQGSVYGGYTGQSWNVNTGGYINDATASCSSLNILETSNAVNFPSLQARMQFIQLTTRGLHLAADITCAHLQGP